MSAVAAGTPWNGTQGIEEAMRSLSSIGATLAESYAALERRAARVEEELERKLGELDAVTRHLAAILDALPTGVVVRDAEGCVVRANGAALAILATSAGELIGAHGHPLLDAPPRPAQAEAGSAAAVRAGPWLEREVEGPDGGRLVIASRKSALEEGGAARGWVEILDDRTALVELGERLHALDKLAALGNMAGGIAHELRNPMHAAQGFAALLERRLEPGTKEQRFARRIVEGLTDAEAVLSSMLTLAAPRPLLRESIDPVELVDEAVRVALAPHVAEGTAAQWRIERDVDAPPFQGDRLKLRQALRNLVANALEAQPDGGTLRIQARAQGGRLELRVADAGPGIPAELRARILDPFFTTRPQGTGLGLALVGAIAGLHGGSVDVRARRSDLGGADIGLILPLSPATVPASAT